MKKMLGIAMLVTLAAPSFVLAEGKNDAKFIKAAAGKGIPGTYIVVFNDEVRAADAADSLAASVGGQVKDRWTVVNGVSVKGISEEAAKAMANDSRVAYVEEEQIYTTQATQSGATWGIDRIDQRNRPLSGTYTYNYNGTGVHAYIIDTGIRTSHTLFGGRAIWKANYADTNNSDCQGHGTHVAGTVGSSTYGVAKNVALYAVKVLDCSGNGTTTGVINGVNWVTNNRVNPAVANMSLGGGKSSTLDSAVNNSVNSGVFYAVAAGNNNKANACNYSPAGASGAYTVGSTTSGDVLSSFSNVGSCVKILAPGSSITSTWHTSTTATNTISGTSMASPHVAGVAALYLDQVSMSVATIKSTLTNNATNNVVSSVPTGTVNKLLYSIN